MKTAVAGAGQKAMRTLNGFTTGQKTMTAFALVALIVGGSLFYGWASAPTYAPLFSNLSGADASACVRPGCEGLGDRAPLSSIVGRVIGIRSAIR